MRELRCGITGREEARAADGREESVALSDAGESHTKCTADELGESGKLTLALLAVFGPASRLIDSVRTTDGSEGVGEVSLRYDVLIWFLPLMVG